MSHQSDALGHVVLGVCGGIAAYKACEVLRGLTEAGESVVVIPTKSALNFVGSATWEALSGHPVSTSVFDNVDSVAHVALGKQARLLLIAPATANFLAKLAAGIADDLLTATALTARCPIVVFPAMHTEMWEHPATVDNVSRLRARGVHVLDPDVGRLTGSDSGAGRLPHPQSILSAAWAALDAPRATPENDLSGMQVVVTGGGTQEPLDPVRFVGNRSSGRQAWALAATAVARGATVHLIAANVDFPRPAGVTVENVSTAEQMAAAVARVLPQADVLVMAAAVADFSTDPAAGKIKKSDTGSQTLRLELQQTTDILAASATNASSTQIVVGFAAETAADRDELISLASHKLAAKGADLLVANNVSGGQAFGADSNDTVILGRDRASGSVRVLQEAAGSKFRVSHAVWDNVLGLGSGPND